jgi:hypothetical protein
MTQSDVISSEEKMAVERTENNVLLNYLFAQDTLVGAFYKLDDNYLNSDHFIQTYLQFKQVLTKKYGPPSEEFTNWLNDTYRNNRNKWGLALSLGHTEYAAFWKTQNTTIECSLREEDYNVLCIVEFWSIGYSHLLEEGKKEDKIDLF